MAALLIVILVFLAPLGGGIALFVLWRRGKPYPSCGKCGYNVTASVGAERCPECGLDFTVAGIVPAGGGRKPLLFWAATLLIVSSIGFLGMGLSSYMYQRATQARQRAVAARQAAAATTPTPASQAGEQEEVPQEGDDGDG